MGRGNADLVVPSCKLKKSGDCLKLPSEIFKVVGLFPSKLRCRDLESSLLIANLVSNPVDSLLQIATNVAHFSVFGLDHRKVPRVSERLGHRPK